MIFSIVILILLLAIAFFHYLQGLFSATISAICAVIAAVLSFSWHETIVERLLGGKMANSAHAMVLVVLFAVIYILLRTLFDKAIPGSVRLPTALDRMGGGLMGIVAGCYALGIIAIAAQELPIGPSVAGYTKYDASDVNGQVPKGGNGGRLEDGYALDSLKSLDAGKFEDNDRKILFPPVDEIVIGTVNRLSSAGSMQGSQPLSSVHPDFGQELFGGRLGIQAGASHTAMNLPSQTEPAVVYKGAYKLNKVRLLDALIPTVRKHIPNVDKSGLKKVGVVNEPIGMSNDGKPIMRESDIDTAQPGQVLFVIRLYFGIDASDRDDGLLRFSPGSVRLVGKFRDPAGGETVDHDYYPLGTLEFDPTSPAQPTLYVSKPDDYLFVDVRAPSGDQKPGVDLVFAIDAAGNVQNEKFLPGTFLEFKRLFRQDLAGEELGVWLRPNPKKEAIGIFHQGPQPPKQDQPQTTTPQVANSTPTPPTPSPENPPTPPQPAPAAAAFNVTGWSLSNQSPATVGIPSSELTKNLISLPGVPTITLKDKKFQDLSVDAQATLGDLAKGDFAGHDLYAPETKQIVQVECAPPASPWEWMQKVPSLVLTDSAGGENKVSGVFAIVHDADGDKFYARYSGSPDYPITAEQLSPTPTAGTPSRISFAFLLPTGAKPKELKLEGQVVKDLSAMPASK